jgi:hypothetical protein
MNNTTCLNPQQFDSFNRFSQCYKFFFTTNMTRAIIEIIFIASIASINILVIVKIRRKIHHNTIYDKILIWLSLSYLLTSLVDFPFFHIEELIGYWAFGATSSKIWAAYDSNMNTFVSLLVLYMTYARYRSIRAPASFLKERLFRYPNLLICSFWLFGAIASSFSAFYFCTFEYSSHIDYNPEIYQFIINFIVWFLPLLGVYILGARIVLILNRVQKIKQSMVSVHHINVFREIFFNPKARFSILIFAFLLQWTVPCLFMLAETFIPIRIDSLILAFKWSTYTVSLTDPILILTFCL